MSTIKTMSCKCLAVGVVVYIVLMLVLSDSSFAQRVKGGQCGICGTWYEGSHSCRSNNSGGGGDGGGGTVVEDNYIDPATEAYNTGVELANQGRYSEAEEYYRRAVSLKPGYAKAHWNLANVLIDQGRKKEGVAEMCEAMRLDPRNKKYKKQLGEWEEYLKKIQEASRQNANIDAFNAATNRGIALFDKGDYQGAEASFRESLQYFPQDVTGNFNLGVSLYEQGQLVEAKSVYSKVLRLDPNHSKALNNLDLIDVEIKKQAEQTVRLKEEITKKEEDGEDILKINRILSDLKEPKTAATGEQLKSVVTHSLSADELSKKGTIHNFKFEEASAEARKGFDTTGVKAGSLRFPKGIGKNRWKAPVVTNDDRKRVPAIVEYEKKRHESRERRYQYKEKLDNLKSLPEDERSNDWSVHVAEANQKISNAANEEIFYNFQIGESLK
ncbi:MAG: tetratricopeptide repeat protein [Nitrospira sp.]|nr:tetratricopeptide repeat protein [Nitrospira sp.]